MVFTKHLTIITENITTQLLHFSSEKVKNDLVLISLDQVFATVINLKEISKYLFDLKKNQHHYSEI